MARRGGSGRKSEGDDFGGISWRRAAFYIAVLAVTHPLAALKALSEELGHAFRWALRAAGLPFRVLALNRYERHRSRRPTFEDHLRRDADGA
ncbi:hypothetical protein [Spirillospora sp. NPDC029432]|uniref:hypothetical protein n=1 Tax=Spirillospora sp. NPDC029432 TaxID=3154599 RepID=UPI0034547207